MGMHTVIVKEDQSIEETAAVSARALVLKQSHPHGRGHQVPWITRTPGHCHRKFEQDEDHPVVSDCPHRLSTIRNADRIMWSKLIRANRLVNREGLLPG